MSTEPHRHRYQYGHPWCLTCGEPYGTAVESLMERARRLAGRGEVPAEDVADAMIMRARQTRAARGECPDCYGSGVHRDELCPTCKGRS